MSSAESKERPAKRGGSPWRSRATLAISLAVGLAACSFLPPTQGVPAGLEEQVRVFGSEVAKLRALPILQDVPAGIQDESELRDSLVRV